MTMPPYSFKDHSDSIFASRWKNCFTAMRDHENAAGKNLADSVMRLEPILRGAFYLGDFMKNQCAELKEQHEKDSKWISELNAQTKQMKIQDICEGVSTPSVTQLTKRFAEKEQTSSRRLAASSDVSQTEIRRPRVLELKNFSTPTEPGYFNPKYGRRSKSASRLDYQPLNRVPTGGIRKTAYPSNVKHVLTPTTNDLRKSSDYVLTHQESTKKHQYLRGQGKRHSDSWWRFGSFVQRCRASDSWESEEDSWSNVFQALIASPCILALIAHLPCFLYHINKYIRLCLCHSTPGCGSIFFLEFQLQALGDSFRKIPKRKRSSGGGSSVKKTKVQHLENKSVKRVDLARKRRSRISGIRKEIATKMSQHHSQQSDLDFLDQLKRDNDTARELDKKREELVRLQEHLTQEQKRLEMERLKSRHHEDEPKANGPHITFTNKSPHLTIVQRHPQAEKLVYWVDRMLREVRERGNSFQYANNEGLAVLFPGQSYAFNTENCDQFITAYWQSAPGQSIQNACTAYRVPINGGAYLAEDHSVHLE